MFRILIDKEMSFPEKTIFICDGKKCGKYKEVRKLLKDSIKTHGMSSKVGLVKIECTDHCDDAPILCFQPQNQWFTNVSVRQADTLFRELIIV